MSEAIAEAFVRLRADASGFGADVRRQVGPSLRQTERDLARTNTEFGRFGRGALVGTGALGGLGRAAAFASTAFIGGAGLTYAISSTVKAALESQRVLDQTKNAVEQGGDSWATYGDRINSVITAQSQLSAFDDERLLQAFQNLYRRTGNVTEALRLNALAANVARGRNIDLEASQQIVIKASIGQIGQLRRLGIEIPKNATALQALDLLQRKYANSAETYGRTASGAIDRFKVSVENVQETIGTGLLPILTTALDKANEFLNKPSTQRGIEKGASDTASFLSVWADGLAHEARIFVRAKDDIVKVYDELNPDNPSSHINDFIRAWQNHSSDATFGLIPKGKTPFPGLKVPAPDLRSGLALDSVFVDPNAGLAEAIRNRGKGAAATTTSAQPSTGIPWLDNLLARAEATSGRGDDERVIRRAISILRGRLGKATALGVRTDLQNAINDYAARLASLEEQDAQAVQDALDKRAERTRAAADKVRAGRQAGRDALADLAASLQAQDEQAATRRATLIDSLTQVPEGLALEEQIAEQRGAGEEKLNALRRREAKAAAANVRELKFIHASKEEILRATLTLATINRRIREVNKKDAADSGSRTDIFEQAAREFELYGSNIGPRAPLSGQDARGTVASNVLAGAGKSVTVIQNFLRGEHSVGQALQQAHQAATALR